MSQSDALASIRRHAHLFLDNLPQFKDPYLDSVHAAYEPGALDAKTKHLMALCGGLVSGCTGCILGQTDMALSKGATVDEVLETCGVALSLGGTLAWSQSAKVAAYLEEKGLLD